MSVPAVVLIRHSLRRGRLVILVTGGLLGGFQVLVAIAASTLEGTGTFNQLVAFVPSFFRQALGPSFLAVLSFQGMVSFGYFHPFVVAALVGLAIALGTEPAGEVESGFADLILARPVARRTIVTRTVAALGAATAGILALMLAGTWLGLALFAPRTTAWPPPSLILSLAVNLAALMFCWGSLALAVAAGGRRRSVAGGICGLAALALYLLDYLARVWPPGQRVAWLSPFRYYESWTLLTGQSLPPLHIVVLLGTAVAAIALAYWIFGRRDV